MAKRMAFVLGVLLVVSCSSTIKTTSSKVYLRDGSEGYRIECGGVAPCEQKAGEVCKGRGYRTVQQTAGPLGDNNANKSILVIKCN